MEHYDKVIIREALVGDASFIADCVLASIDLYVFDGNRPKEYASIESVCSMEDTLYSYRNTLVAESGGKPVGCIIAYPGDDYAEVRKRTFEAICKVRGGIDPGNSAMETGRGEFYLDSMAIVPEFRGQGLGHKLMLAQIDRGRAIGCDKFSLIVAKSHPKLQEYYSRLGFRPVGELNFFGVDYFKCLKLI